MSAFPDSVTRDVLAAAVSGEALGAVAAGACGLGVRVVDAGVGTAPVPGAVQARPCDQRGDLVDTDALSDADVDRLLRAGRQLGAAAAGGGLVALGEVGVGNTTVAAALAAVLLGADAPGAGDPADLVGLGASADSVMLLRKREVVCRAVDRARSRYGDELSNPHRALAALGGGEITVLAGVALGAAQAGALVVLDGLATGVAALLVEPGAGACFVAGQRSREAGHPAVLARLGLEPLLDLRLRAGEGAGAALASGLLLAGLAVRRSTARTGPR